MQMIELDGVLWNKDKILKIEKCHDSKSWYAKITFDTGSVVTWADKYKFNSSTDEDELAKNPNHEHRIDEVLATLSRALSDDKTKAIHSVNFENRTQGRAELNNVNCDIIGNRMDNKGMVVL